VLGGKKKKKNLGKSTVGKGINEWRLRQALCAVILKTWEKRGKEKKNNGHKTLINEGVPLLGSKRTETNSPGSKKKEKKKKRGSEVKRSIDGGGNNQGEGEKTGLATSTPPRKSTETTKREGMKDVDTGKKNRPTGTYSEN